MPRPKKPSARGGNEDAAKVIVCTPVRIPARGVAQTGPAARPGASRPGCNHPRASRVWGVRCGRSRASRSQRENAKEDREPSSPGRRARPVLRPARAPDPGGGRASRWPWSRWSRASDRCSPAPPASPPRGPSAARPRSATPSASTWWHAPTRWSSRTRGPSRWSGATGPSPNSASSRTPGSRSSTRPGAPSVRSARSIIGRDGGPRPNSRSSPMSPRWRPPNSSCGSPARNWPASRREPPRCRSARRCCWR